MLSSPWISGSRRVLQPRHLEQNPVKQTIKRAHPNSRYKARPNKSVQRRTPLGGRDRSWAVATAGASTRFNAKRRGGGLGARAGTGCWPCPPTPRAAQRASGAARRPPLPPSRLRPAAASTASSGVSAAPPPRLPSAGQRSRYEATTPPRVSKATQSWHFRFLLGVPEEVVFAQVPWPVPERAESPCTTTLCQVTDLSTRSFDHFVF